MSSWIGWLLIFAALGLVVWLVRALVQLVFWLIEEFAPKRADAGHAKSHERLPRAEATGVSHKPKAKHHPSPTTHPSPLPLGEGRVRAAVTTHPPSPATHHPSRLGRWMKKLKLAVAKKGFDYWVTKAMAEDDAEIKIEYLSKALKLNPGYLPVWGLKGTALSALGRYDEAIQCFDKSLQLHPSALIWHKKADCCYHLGKRQEALECFDKALQICPDQDHELREDIARVRRLVEDELRGKTANPDEGARVQSDK